MRMSEMDALADEARSKTYMQIKVKNQFLNQLQN